MMNWKFIRNVFLKAFLLVTVASMVMTLINFAPAISRLSVYNHLVAGRDRLPFGDTPAKSYNFTVSDLGMMFSTHRITAGKKPSDEFRVILLGDSSIWGFLLKNDETLAGQLNLLDMKTSDGKKVVFYNLGYPTLSVIKDYHILEKALAYQPDLIIWSVTLESLSQKNAVQSPMISNSDLFRLSSQFGLSLAGKNNNPSLFETLVNNRRLLNDWYRLQLYGLMWAATGIDQDYPSQITPAQRDLDADTSFENCPAGDFVCVKALYSFLNEGIQLSANVPVWIVNEPMLISSGGNSDIRYNFYYPRWVYDRYRSDMAQFAQKSNWTYLDLWDLVPENQFTNSAIHLTPSGEGMLAASIVHRLDKFFHP
jgi:hypothetical protein